MGLLWFIAEYALRLIDPAGFERYVEGELGVVENAQNIVLLVALILAIVMLLRRETAGQGALRPWLWVIALGLFYTLGEEMSWGQHYFRWATTGWFALHNDQDETNLHNTSAWFDQKPRLLLLLGLLFGGIVHPLLKRWRGRGLIGRPWWLMPTLALTPLSVLVWIAGSLKALDELKIAPVHFQLVRTSELQEILIYFAMLFYLVSLWRRLRARRVAADRPDALPASAVMHHQAGHAPGLPS